MDGIRLLTRRFRPALPQFPRRLFPGGRTPTGYGSGSRVVMLAGESSDGVRNGGIQRQVN